MTHGFATAIRWGRGNVTDLKRAELALMMKPIIEAKAKAQQARKPVEFVRQNSDEQNSIRTDDTVAELAGVSHDPVRMVEATKEMTAVLA